VHLVRLAKNCGRGIGLDPNVNLVKTVGGALLSWASRINYRGARARLRGEN